MSTDMFAALIEARTSASNGRTAGDRHAIIAVVDGDQDACAPRAVAELEARGWTAIDVKRVGPVVAIDEGAAATYISAAVSDAEEFGFGVVVYEKPIKPA